MKKSIASIVCAAFVLTGPGQAFVFAAGQLHSQQAVELSTLAVPAIGAGIDAPQAGAVPAAANAALSVEAPAAAAAVPTAAVAAPNAAAAQGATTAAGSLENFAGAIAQPGADVERTSLGLWDGGMTDAERDPYAAPGAVNETFGDTHGIFAPSQPLHRPGAPALRRRRRSRRRTTGSSMIE